METLSFVLGIAFVVVIALAIVATYAFVKVIKVQRQIDDLDKRIAACLYDEIRQVNHRIDNFQRDIDQRFADIWQGIAEENRQIHQRVDDFEKDIYSQLDSRLDKLETKLTNKIK